MARLGKELGISETLLKSLEQNKILTILDYLREDSEKLAAMCGVTFKEILELRQNLIGHFSALPVSGTTAYEQLLSSSALIPSGVGSLDSLLCGGFLTGTVYELCGSSGDGKTQLCLAIAANVAVALKQTVHYVDTKGDFSALRVCEMMKHKNASEEECKSALERIEVTRIFDIYELIRFLHNLERSFGEEDCSPPRVVIIDSMTALYFQFLGSNEPNEGFGLVSHAMSTMKAIATEYHVLFIEVNLASSFVEAEACAEYVEVEENKNVTSDVQPMLGKYWLHAPNTRLLVNRLNNEAPQRLIRVTKSTYLPLGASCIVNVLSKGVV